MTARPFAPLAARLRTSLRTLALRATVLGAVLLTAGCRTAVEARPAIAVPFPSGRVEATNGVVSSGNLLASEAGLEMLRRGGNAIDAAVATAFALNVVDPMMAGIGGGGGMTIWLAREHRAQFVEFYPMTGSNPVAPNEGGVRTPERATLIPGAVAGLLAALERYGTLPREVVMAPAIRLARDGFPAHTWLARVVSVEVEKLAADSVAARLLLPGGKPIMPGERVVQPALAATLEHIARDGRDGFYRGDNARAVVARLNAGGNPVTLDDFAGYKERWYQPLCSTFAGRTVLTSPPPLGGAQVLEMLHLAELRGIPQSGPPASTAASLVAVADVIRTARSDWSGYNGFPGDAAVPARGLASDAYAQERLEISRAPLTDSLHAGDPWGEDSLAVPASCARVGAYPATTLPRPTRAPDNDADADIHSETTHFSVVDRDRNAVSLTFTLGLHFGSGVYVNGAWYNSANSNFGRNANRRGPHRVASSTIAPTIVLENGELRMVVGSPASAYIQPAVLQTMLNTLVFGADPWTSVATPRLNTVGNTAHIEGGFPAASIAALRARGYSVAVHRPIDDVFGAVQMILVTEQGKLIGAADPRREGAALGW